MPALTAAGAANGTDTKLMLPETLASATVALARTVPDGTPVATLSIATVSEPAGGQSSLTFKSRSTWSKPPLIPAVNVCAIQRDPATE